MYQQLISQNIFTQNYPSNENYRVPRVKQDFDGNFVLGGYKDVLAENSMRPYVFKVSHTGQKLDSAIYFNGMPYDCYIMDVLIDTNYYYFIGFSGDYNNIGHGPNDSSMFLLKTDYNFNPIDTHYYSIVNNEDIIYGTSKFDYSGNIITTGYYFNSTNHFGSFINKISKNGDSLHFSTIPADSNRLFINQMMDSNYYYVFGFRWSNNIPRLLYKYDTALNIVDTYLISSKAQQYYSPIKISNNRYFTSGYITSGTYPNITRKFAIIKSTIEGVLIDSLEFGVVDSTNFPAFYDALCMQNGYLYFAGSVYGYNTLPPYGENRPSNLYIAKLDTSLNIQWEKLIGGDAYYTAMSVIGTSDGGVLMMGSRNVLDDNKNNLDIQLVKLDSNGQTTWIKNISFSKTKIRLYPNPASIMLNIELSASEEKISEVEIYNALGQSMLSINPQSAKAQIDIRRLPSGVYIMEGRTLKGQRFSGKFVKE